MHDAVSAYAYDTFVVDDPDADREDLTVQLRMDDGQWHAKMIGGMRTKCGKPIDWRHRYEPRGESYEGNLCLAGCFSAAEVAENERITKERRSNR
jgi:hypothetical protein